MAYGTFEGRVEDKRSNAARWMVALTAIGLAACVIAIATVAIVPAKPTALYAAMDKRDGTDALVNAILVARGDSMPTNFVASKLNIDPKMPFRGSSALHAARKTRKAALKSQQGLKQMLAFCADAADCMRDIAYFQQNAQFHQAAQPPDRVRVVQPGSQPGRVLGAASDCVWGER